MVPMIAIFDGLSVNRPRARLDEATRRGGKTGPAEAYFAQIPPCVRIHWPFVASRPLRQIEGDGLNRRREITS